MADIYKIPNSTVSWNEAAQYIIRNRCNNGTKESVEAYAEQLRQANPGRPDPTSADIRVWSRLMHWLGSDINLEGPAPECKAPEPPAPPPVTPPPPVEPPKPVEPPPPVETPVSAATKDKGKKAMIRANGAIARLSQVGGTSGPGIIRAREEAQQALDGTSDDKAKKAIDRLNVASSRGEAEYQKIRGGL